VGKLYICWQRKKLITKLFEDFNVGIAYRKGKILKVYSTDVIRDIINMMNTKSTNLNVKIAQVFILVRQDVISKRG
jgi:hypothetical protein